MRQIPLLYFPASVLLVDDDQDFLLAYQKVLADTTKFNIIIEQNPLKVINVINGSHRISSDSLNNIQKFIDTGYISTIDVFKDTNRHSLINIIIIDYGMPAIDGLELAKQLKNYDIRKILLTGDADSSIGLAGFNEEIISKFLQKKDEFAIDKLKNFIHEQAENYFFELSRELSGALSRRNRIFFKDKNFISLFEQLLEKYSVSEYYLIDEYGSYIFFSDKFGKLVFLVLDGEGMALYQNDKNTYREPFDKVRKFEEIPFFGINNSLDSPEFHKCKVLPGTNTNYYWSIINLTEKEKIMSYNVSLNEIKEYNTHIAAVNPRKAALIVIEMQNVFKNDLQIISDDQIRNIKDIIKASEEAGTKIIYVMHNDSSEISKPMVKWWESAIEKDSKDWQMLDEFDTTGKTVIHKNQYSAFHKTDLDSMLKKDGIEDVIITGVMTNCCCETSAREAFMLGYRVFFINDATSTTDKDLHLATLKNLSFGFAHVQDTANVVNDIRNNA